MQTSMTHPATSTPFMRVLGVYLFALPIILLFSGMSALLFLSALLLLLIACAPRERWREIDWREVPRSTPFQITALLFFWALITSWHSITPEISFVTSVKTMALMAGGSFCLWLATREPSRLSRMTALAMPAALLIATFIVLQEIFFGYGLIYYFYSALPSEMFGYYDKFMNKNINRGLCAFAVLMWPAMLGLMTLGYKRFAYLMPLLILPGLLVMHSLSSKMGLAVGAAVFYGALFFPRMVTKAMMIALPLLMLLWPFAVYVLREPVQNSQAIYSALPESSKHRLGIWHFAIERIAEKPLMGWGMDTARSMPGGKDKLAPGMDNMPLHTHNSLFQILMELGVVGFVLAMVALLLVLRAWNRIPKSEPLRRAASAASIVSYLAIGMTAFGVWQGWWICIAWLTAALLRLLAKGSS